ncbi:glycosyl transferase [Enterobacter ludwigii]|uniref:glycosyl transferase n=1 Tax=Enterobacter ludwigii TaxID=299767 RepID=UPI003076045E
MRFIIIGYRDSYFWNEFGTSVRDLQIAEILARKHEVIFLNRPVSIYERLMNKRKEKGIYKPYSDRIRFVDITSTDILGPLKGRLWTENCYVKIFQEILEKYTKNYDGKVIVIDFTPLAKIEYKNLKNVFYWYDLIDNFVIHNRFSEIEKKIVSEKYEYVNKYANLITGVSKKAIMGFSNPNSYIMPNGVYIEPNEVSDSEAMKSEKTYDLGFVGFITNKFDVSFVNKLSEKFSIVIWGKFYDESIQAKLNKNIRIAGSFNYSNLPSIMKTFKVGLLPYLQSKSHDESPLKMYEYFKHGLACVSSMNFEIESKWFSNYNVLNDSELENTIYHFIENWNSDDIKRSIKDEWFFENKIQLIVKSLL